MEQITAETEGWRGRFDPISDRRDRSTYFQHASGVPSRHRAFDPSKLADGRWHAKYQRLLGIVRAGGMVALLGPRGTGKTQMAVEAIRCAVLHYGMSAWYARTMDMLIRIRSTYNGDGEREADAVAAYTSPYLLVLDEIQVRSGSEWEDNKITAILDGRYMEGRPTIMVSNLKHEAFMLHIGDSIYDRIVETGGVIECDWPSFRTAGGEP